MLALRHGQRFLNRIIIFMEIGVSQAASNAGRGVATLFARNPSESRSETDHKRLSLAFALISSLFVLMIVISLIGHMLPFKEITYLGIGGLIFITAILSGCFIGFLFGIPRSAPSAGNGGQAPYSDNTNLEQVSDWVTKIIVGLGIMQIDSFDESLSKIARYIGKSYTGFLSMDVAEPLCMTLVLSGFIIGFLFAYINSRTFISSLFANFNHNTQDQAVARLRDYALSTEKKPDAEVRNAAEQLADMDPEQAATPQDKLAIAKAQFLMGRRDDAASSFELAMASARRSQQSEVTVEATLNYIFGNLYRPLSQGYLDAIREGERLSREPLTPAQAAQLYAYLAAAHGQRHIAAVRANKPEDAADARAAVLQCVEKALANDHSGAWTATIRGMLDKDSADNDLHTLADDGELRRLLGMPPAA